MAGSGMTPVDDLLRVLNADRRLIAVGLATARAANADRLLDEMYEVDGRIAELLDEREAGALRVTAST